MSHLKDSGHQTDFILHKDNASKYKMKFLNDDFIYLGKKLSKPTWPYVKN